MIAIIFTVIVGIPLGNGFRVSQPYYAVGRDGKVSLQCTYTRTNVEELHVSVYKGMYGREVVCSARVNLTDPRIETEGGVHCKGNASQDTVDLTIFGLTGEDTDLYRCQVEFLFPPPYLSIVGNGTLVHIQETPDCHTEHSQARIQETPETTPTQSPSLHIILLCAILITTTITLTLQVMKMVLIQQKPNRMAQIVSQKSDYRNFW
ncbi:T-cell-specific surface glycoprotein CD28 [Brachyhypopomus gauderio]|uniref:T-cell-specific surface glycoprotein CD28 n=1 Tax=Brachyhypopomus gauderio TaxID=698409 RepID=UPI0040427AE6